MKRLFYLFALVVIVVVLVAMLPVYAEAAYSEGILAYAENNKGVQPPIFSKQGGLYEDGFELELDSLQGNTIYYTLDGSEPVPESEATMKYVNPILIDSRVGQPNVFSIIQTAEKWKGPVGEVFKAWTVKAITVDSSGKNSKSITNSYFIGKDIFERYNLPIISITAEKADFFDLQDGIYVQSETPETSQIPIHIEAYGKDGELWFSQNAGAKIHGHSSSNLAQKSLRIYADNDYDVQDTFEYDIFPELLNDNGEHIESFKRLLLRNSGNDWGSTMLRDGLMQQLVSHLNVDTQAFRPCVVFLNGEFWGIHNIRERFDKYYFASHYDFDKDDLAMLSWALSSKETIEIEEGTVNDMDAYQNDIIQYLKENSIEDDDVYEYIKEKMDIDNFIDYQLSHIYFANTDWPGNNVVVWKYKTKDGEYHPEAPQGQDGRWRWVVKDTDFGFGYLWDASHDTLSYSMEACDPENDPEKGVRRGRNFEWAVFLFKTLLNNENFRNEFINRFADNINTSFNAQRVNDVLYDMQAEIEKAMPEHIARWQSISNWEANINTIKKFVNARPNYMRELISDKFEEYGVDGTAQMTLNCDSTEGHIKINSIEITDSTPGVTNTNSWTGTYFKGVDVTLTAIPQEGYVFDHWEGGKIDERMSDVITVSPDEMNITAVFVNENGTNIKGDLNGSKSVNAIDYAILRAYLLDLMNLSERNITAADLDNNSTVNEADFNIMRKFLLGILDRLQ